jgi:hypothetical protein
MKQVRKQIRFFIMTLSLMALMSGSIYAQISQTLDFPNDHQVIIPVADPGARHFEIGWKSIGSIAIIAGIIFIIKPVKPNRLAP